MRPAYALPNVTEAEVSEILAPVLAKAAGLSGDHSIITAKEALNRLWFVMHDAQRELTELDARAAREHVAQMREDAA